MKLRRLSSPDGSIVQLGFWCPGCEMLHAPQIKGPKAWTFNDDHDRPTFAPSILVQFTMGDEQRRCHSFVQEGQIEFLSDCTHPLAGKTVPMPELPDWLQK